MTRSELSNSEKIECQKIKSLGLCNISRLMFPTHRQKSAIGVEARSYISQGQLVPDSTITKLMMAELKKLERKNWLLDGEQGVCITQ